jgi:hypothetical protein
MELNKVLTDAERGFNVCGGIPVVALVSSALRITASKIQFLAGAIVGILGLIGQMVSDDAKWENLARKGLELLAHGGWNFLRGLGEFVVACTVVGSLGLLVGQYLSKNKFEPIYKYEEPAAPAVAV